MPLTRQYINSEGEWDLVARGARRSRPLPQINIPGPKEAGNSIGCLGRNFPARVA